METPNRIHDQLVDLAARVVAIDVRPYEAPGESTQDLCATVQTLADATNALFVRVSEAEDAGLREASDLAFMAIWELRQRLERLAQIIGSGDSWAVIAACSSIRRRVIYALVEIERALAAGLGGASRLTSLTATNVDIARASRRAYLSFIRAIRAIEKQISSGELTHGQALRLSAANLAKLIGRDVYQDLRIDDRRQLRGLQQRILQWARERISDELHARRLWQDVAASAELLTGIHRRTELIEHDLALLARTLAAGRNPAAERLEALAELEFRCPDFDRCWIARGPGAADRELLVAMHDQLAAVLGRPQYVGSNLANHGA